jgi:hypothetical protein
MRTCKLRWLGFPFQVAVALMVFANGWAATREFELRIDQGRPVGNAILELDKRHNLLITYEDPRYEYEGDLRDDAPEVRRNLHEYPPGNVPPVVVPASGMINLRYAVSTETGKPTDVEALMREIIEDHNSRGALGRFALHQNGEYLHVVPASVRNRLGEWDKQGSILDVAIDLPQENRSTLETLRALCNAITERVGFKVEVGSMPLNLVVSTRSDIGAENEVARSVLKRILRATKSDLAWFLFYGPGRKTYVLNLLPVAKQPQAPATPPSNPTENQLPVLPHSLTEKECRAHYSGAALESCLKAAARTN